VQISEVWNFVVKLEWLIRAEIHAHQSTNGSNTANLNERLGTKSAAERNNVVCGQLAPVIDKLDIGLDVARNLPRHCANVAHRRKGQHLLATGAGLANAKR
jgi:hypothetical protein